MGGQVSSCLFANCTQDTNHDFSEVLSNSNEVDNTLILDTDIIHGYSDNAKTVYTPREKALFQLKSADHDLSFDELSNSDTMSQQSVLSTISPTKDRGSPKRARGIEQSAPSIIDGLSLNKLGDKEQHVAAGDDLYEIISTGQCENLAFFAKLKNVDLRSVVFQDRKHTCLHVAVLHNQLTMVNYLVGIGVDINARDKEGFTALGLAYEQSSQEIISLLISTKAKEFSNSPYSPYALSVASATRSQRSYSESGQLQPHELVRKSSFDVGDTLSVSSDTPTGAWNTPSSQPHIAAGLAAHSPYRMDLTPSAVFDHPPKLVVPTGTPVTPVAQDSTVRRRMTLLTESLDRLVQTDRHRSFSLPASSPVFAEVARARSPTDPPALVPMIAQCDWAQSSEDQTPLSARSDDGSQDTGASTQSAPAAAAGDALNKKPKKPLGTRLRKAAGRAMALIVPSRGMPPRPKPPVSRPPAQQAVTAPAAPHTALSIAVDDSAEATAENGGSVGDHGPVHLAELAETGQEMPVPAAQSLSELVDPDQRSESNTSSVNGESVFTDLPSHD